MSNAAVKVVVACLACEDKSVVLVAQEHAANPLQHSIFTCSECGARIAYGTLETKVVIEPYLDEAGRQWVRKRYQDFRTREELFVVDLDPQYAAMEAKNVLSLVIP